MIATAMYIFGAAQGAWSLTIVPVVCLMIFDLIALGAVSPEINL